MAHSDTSDDAIENQRSVAMPRLGGITASWLVFIAVAVFLAAPHRGLLIVPVDGQAWQGLMWGSVSVTVWMLAAPPATAPRRLGAVVVLAILFWWFHHCSGRPLIRYIISIGSFALLQLAAATILGWPGWSVGRQSPQAVSRYRFGIGGVMLLTAGIAVVLAAMRTYQAPQELFHGSRVSAVGMVSIALAAQMAMVSRRHVTRWAVATFASFGLTVALLGSLHAWQVSLWQQSAAPGVSASGLFNAASWSYYIPPLLSYAATVAGTALCGRLDHETERTRRSLRSKVR